LLELLSSSLVVGAAGSLANLLLNETSKDAARDFLLHQLGDRPTTAVLHLLHSKMSDRNATEAKHDIVRAMRRAQLRSLRALLNSFLATSKHLNRATDLAFAHASVAWIREQLAKAKSLPVSEEDREAAVEAIGVALAGDASGLLRRAREVAEESTWSELDAAHPNPPEGFRSLFLGAGPHTSWFEAFGVAIEEEIKSNEEFRQVLFGVQLSATTNEVLQNKTAVAELIGRTATEQSAQAEFRSSASETLDRLKEDLALLRTVAPRHSLSPGVFELVHSACSLFRKEGESHPIPSWREYIDGRVPSTESDALASIRLTEFGWIYVHGGPAAGKTTLALRLALEIDRALRDIYYLDLGKNAGEGVMQAFRDIALSGATVILDNIHWDPGLTNRLWGDWQIHGAGGHLYLLATLVDSDPIEPPQDSLKGLANHPLNPAIRLRPGATEFGAIAQFLYARRTGKSLDRIPQATLDYWRGEFGGQLHAFGFAVFQSISALSQQRWSQLTMVQARRWISKNWLRRLTDEEIANVNCLSAFGTQDLELHVPQNALPYPDRLGGNLRALGLYTSSRSEDDAQRPIRLTEPGWGSLLLEAQSAPPNTDDLLLSAALKHLPLALDLSQRLKATRQATRCAALWTGLAAANDQFWASAARIRPQRLKELLIEAKEGPQPTISGRIVDGLAANPEAFALSAWAPPVSHLASLLNYAVDQNYPIDGLWTALESKPNLVKHGLLDSPLGHAGSFLETARIHGRNVEVFWAALEEDYDAFLARAQGEPLHDLGAFIRFAKLADRDLHLLFDGLRPVMPEKLKKASYQSISGFFRAIPDELIAGALEGLTPEDLLGVHPNRQRFAPMPWIAMACRRIGRNDLADPLILTLLSRAKPRDFPLTQDTSFFLAIWILSNTPPECEVLVKAFTERVCTKSWISGHCRNTSINSISRALSHAGLNQPQSDCRKYQVDALYQRIGQELESFLDEAAHEAHGEAIRLLGAAALTGMSFGKHLFKPIRPAQVEILPTLAVPHDPSAEFVERWQSELWIGMRVYSTITRRSLFVAPEAAEQTLRLWRRNAEVSLANGNMRSLAVDQGMIGWLERATATQPVTLLPVAERLSWVLRDRS
jgi:hypothetical protein